VLSPEENAATSDGTEIPLPKTQRRPASDEALDSLGSLFVLGVLADVAQLDGDQRRVNHA
jgi:hypothetical protein